MMTYKEALARKLSRLRHPKWNAQAFVYVYYQSDGSPEPWCHLYDPPGQQALGAPIPQVVPTRWAFEPDEEVEEA